MTSFSIPKKPDTFTVIYRTGGEKRCQWRRQGQHRTRDEAATMAETIERQGYKALVHVTRVLDVIGMPTGWQA